MMEEKNYLADSSKLRQKAEEQILKEMSESNIPDTEADMLKLIHELKVHQVELEMQNEELQLAKAKANDAVNLYDLAPTGYFTLSTEGTILKLNLCGSQMLGKDRARLINSRLGFFISDETKPVYNNFLDKVFISNRSETCEVILTTHGNLHMNVQLTGKISGYEQQCLVIIVDITESKQAEEELRRSEVRYRTLVENSPDAIVVYAQGKIVLVNKEGLNQIGASSPDELIGKQVIQFVHPDYKEFAIERMKKMANEEAVLPLVEEKIVKLDGSETDVEVKAMSIKFDNKPAIQLIIRDITQRKLGEEALRVSERQYRDMFYKNTAVKLIIDPDSGEILNVNEAASKFYGYSVNRLEKMNINQINILNEEQLETEMALARFEQRDRFDFRHRLASGEVRDVEVYSGPIEFDGSVRLYSIVHDVTDRKRTQALLSQMNWRLESLVESTHIGTWEWNIQTGETVFNERWAQILGYSLDELAPVSTLSYTHI